MIFVTVGTHEQQFNRLVKMIDLLKANGEIEEDVIIQTGYSTYEPTHCKWSKLFPYQEMKKLVEEARIVVTHGGPSSFIMPLQIGKIPVVVPRSVLYEEHVNNHQIEFCQAVAERMKNIILVENVDNLKDVLKKYDEIAACYKGEMKSNNELFNENIKNIVAEMFNEK